ncbi:DUF4389 domain-containing protein [Candidatus Synchoanobacter obligatus]|jgi:hypothetical protein|uniref:DUF4389 domain-containing protein n=1 Tax=Candidatus Synchoanobacter obligatus TaxID=2919597 RepID=A0ABT1L4G0_9GAMM|nr:DUF4389 domain-containing protein [Candidatus Synchoanobacter obligatus]MCP8352062.1 DUF4389 domain-containing protein [Candidatus Synchoanobacter obligatus]
MPKNTSSILIRVFFSLLLIFLAPMLGVIILIAIIQTTLTHLSHQPNMHLLDISKYIISYICQIVEYLTMVSHTPPYPFSPWNNRYDH